ncbi:ABC transporter permease protein [Gloeobacter violaceus PCC 7421]|uniref:ABC transporter permease protein n=2 Tax=Gloeobacter violaceus TaxID=33072 RepID=Q7NG60_GLOVI|nr:ABC transporter permease protein [Gloeobacter violaceus PCC 7421]
MEMGWLEWLAEPLRYPFMQRALLSALLVGTICAITGSYLIVRRLALLGDAVSRAVMPGLAIAFIVGGNIFVGAFIAGVLSTALIGYIHTHSKIKEDTAMGLVFSGFFATGIILITKIQSETKVDLMHFLFGNILGVSESDLLATAVISAAVVATILLLFKELLFHSFDPLGAKAAGLPTEVLHLVLMSLIALTIVASMQSVGVVLVIALMIAPGATAYLLTRRLPSMMGLAVLLGAIASLVGLYLSYYLDIASGPAVVVVSIACFVLAFLFSPRQGLLTRLWQDRKADYAQKPAPPVVLR